MIYLLITCIIFYAILIISNKYFGERALITIGIGSAMGINFYNIVSFPILVAGYSVSLETFLYTLFIFCLILSCVFYGKKSAENLLIIVVCAILFTAVLEFLAILSSTTIFKTALLRLFGFIVNIISILISGWLGIRLFYKLSNKVTPVVNIIIFILLANIVKTLIDITYLITLSNKIYLASALITIIPALVFSVLSYIVIKKYPYKQKKLILNTIK